MSKLLITLPYSAGDAVLAERLCDYIYQLNGKSPLGHALLVAASDTHEELRIRVGIAAKLAFEDVTELVAPDMESQKTYSKAQYAEHLFKFAATHIQKNFRWPFAWVEPDSVPTNCLWRERLSDAYEAQPRRYMGSIMRQGESLFMARVGVYSPAAGADQDRAPDQMVSKCTKTKLIQQLVIGSDDDLSKVREDAVLVHGDKAGILMEHLKEKPPLPMIDMDGEEKPVKVTVTTNGNLKCEEGIPNPMWETPKIDRRTRAGRALAAKQTQVV